MTIIEKTRGQKVNEDITALIKARHTLLWVVTREELRVESALVDAVAAARSQVAFWDCGAGFTSADRKPLAGDVKLAEEALRYIEGKRTRNVYVMRDLHKWLGDPVSLRLVRNLAKDLQTSPQDEARTIIVLTPVSEVPPELAGHATVIEYPLPDRAEVSTILDEILNAIKPNASEAGKPNERELVRERVAPNGMRELAIDAAVGLTAEEATNCYAKSLITAKCIDPKAVSAEKRRVIAREKVLTWYEPDPRGLEAVGGLELLKAWLILRRKAFSPAARAYGLQAPRGMLLVGLPGGGKSLTAKCVASAWGVPLLRLDWGALMSKFVGESGTNFRKALQVAEAVSPCVLWVDEIEKAVAGATGPQGDGGVSSDMLGAFLSWMQERQGSVFVVATANDVRALPPELLRKGRFDEMFWIDLPTNKERAEVLRATLAQHGKTVSDPDALGSVVALTAGFTGAEIAAIVPDAMFAAFSDGEREISCTDLRYAAKTVVPLSKTSAEKVDALREWAKTRARPASEPEETATRGTGGRSIEM